jgi:deoxycytidine triphosphate deaminase
MADQGGRAGLVAGEQLKALVADIFLGESGSTDQVHGSKYEVRLARDYLWIRDEMYTPARRLPEGAVVRLQPGDCILVATIEEFRMPWWLTASIGLKYGLVSQGLYALVGSFVDPGYGRTSGKDRGERLHFMLANTSREVRELRPGQAILSLQFHRHADMESERAELAKVHGTGKSLRETFEDPDAGDPREGLSFFPDMRGVERSVKDLWNRAELVIALGMLVVVSALIGAIATVLFELLSRPDLEKALDGAGKLLDHPLVTLGLLIWCVSWVIFWQELFRHWAKRHSPFAPRQRSTWLRRLQRRLEDALD